jgi:hypothetical protein
VQLGLSGIKNYNMQAMLEFCVCLIKCGSTDKANTILSQILKSPVDRDQQEAQARLISGRVGNLRVLRDLDITFAKCIVSLTISSPNNADREDIDDSRRAPLNFFEESCDQHLVKITSELCSRCGTSERMSLPTSEELLSWCLDQHFDQRFLSNSRLLDDIAEDIRQQEQLLHCVLHDAGKSSKMKEDAQLRMLDETSEKFEKWKQIVDTW